MAVWIVSVVWAVALAPGVATAATPPEGPTGPTASPPLVSAVPEGGWSAFGAGECGGSRVADDDVGPPPYYAIDLVSTRRIPGSGEARGTAAVTFAGSPFGISISAMGGYVQDLAISVDRLKPAKTGAYVVWITTPDLDEVVRAGVLDDEMRASGQVSWNKFLVVITLEDSVEESADGSADRSAARSSAESGDGTSGIWQGPIVLRGASRSGRMHTMAGHGPFQLEPCIKYGYE